MASDMRNTDDRAVLPRCAGPEHGNSPSPVRPALHLVTARFNLVCPDEPAGAEWHDALDVLLGWLGLAADMLTESQTRSTGKLPRWATPAAMSKTRAPVFAPWLVWSPSAFQLGGLAGLPQADWAVSYLSDPGAGLTGGAARGIDLALMSPLPSACSTDDAKGVPVPRGEVLRAMLQTARAQGRTRIAIICQARQRNAIARLLLAVDRSETRDGLTLDIITIEDALRPLMAGAAPWDAVIAMPDVRSIIFALLAESTGVRGPWPMAWHRLGGQGKLLLVTSERSGEGQGRMALDAPALVQALALYCHNGGARQAARRLYDGWARLRDSGVATAGRGSNAPYARQVSDAEYVAMLTKDLAASKREVPHWCALGEGAASPATGATRGLRVVCDNSSILFQ